jgi:hypothetical protein
MLNLDIDTLISGIYKQISTKLKLCLISFFPLFLLEK